MRPIPATPSFALVGQPNEGKTTVMATLAEDDGAAISPVPGTTQQCHAYPVKLNGQEILVFFDTPGFENTDAVLHWFQQNANLPDPLNTFLLTFRESGKFKQELEILRPLHEGAAAMYVADASRPVREIDRQEIEILRLSGVRRIGVINSKEERGEYLDEWKHLMRRDFNHIHEFNGHRATFQDRIRLLEAARAVIQEWEGPMNRSIKALQDDWESRLRELTSLIVKDLRAMMEIRERETIQYPGDAARASAEAKERLMKTVREREVAFRKRTRQIFHHSDERWVVSELLNLDLFDEQVWKVLGLNRAQLALAGALIGALIGGYIDAHTLGATFMTGAVFGFLTGGILAWLSVDKAVAIDLPGFKVGPFSFGGGKMGGQQAEASITPQSNVLWVVLDRYLMYVERCASWAHGRRLDAPVPLQEEGESKVGFTAKWDKATRGKVMDFVGHLRRGRPNSEKLDQAEQALREMLRHQLRTLTVR